MTMSSFTATVCSQSANSNPVDFLQLLPLIRRYARQCFRGLNTEAREEAIQEVVANSFAAFRRLVERGNTLAITATPLARFAVAQTRGGRHVGGHLNIRDVSSDYCRRRNGVEMKSIDQIDAASGAWEQILVEDPSSTPADIVAIRLDFQNWLESLTHKHRQIAEVLSTGETTQDTARLFKVTSARISQLRSQLKAAWADFQRERPEPMLASI